MRVSSFGAFIVSALMPPIAQAQQETAVDSAAQTLRPTREILTGPA